MGKKKRKVKYSRRIARVLNECSNSPEGKHYFKTDCSYGPPFCMYCGKGQKRNPLERG